MDRSAEICEQRVTSCRLVVSHTSDTITVLTDRRNTASRRLATSRRIRVHERTYPYVTLRAEETPAASLGTRACAPVGAMPRRGGSMTCVGGDGYHSGGAMPVHASTPCGSMGSANTCPFRGLARCQTSGRLFFLRRL